MNLCLQVMDAESGELFLGVMASGSWQLDGPFSSSELIPAGSEKPLQDWAVDPECVSVCDHMTTQRKCLFETLKWRRVFPCLMWPCCS